MMADIIHTTGDFDQLLLSLWQREGRIYTDEELATLPFIYESHPHYNEWVMRKHSQKALVSYIKNKKIFSNILEVGCGNGWLTSCIAKATDAQVTGIDVNAHGLQQAERVFKNIPNLQFMNDMLQGEDLKDEKYDMIIFAASIQFFESLKHIIKIAVEHLTLQGEVHIIDSPFYLPQQIASASQTARAYYNRIGLPEMDHYHHYHTLNDLANFQYKILHHPNSWKNKLSIKKNPFYWICIKNRYQ